MELTVTDAERWRMTAREEEFLDSLPEVVDLYRAYSEAGETHYLSARSACAGLRARAFSGDGRLEHIAVPCERVVAVDLVRDVAQLGAR